MPELPEVEHVRRGIAPLITHHQIQNVVFSEKVMLGKSNGKETIIKGMTLDDFKQATIGYKITHVDRRSKYILLHLEKQQDQRMVIAHLGMSGAFFVVSNIEDIPIPNFKKHWHVILELDNGQLLVYSDVRRFGELRNVQTLSDYPSILDIAPEPFSKEAEAHFLKQFNDKKYQRMPIKQMILDHKVVAGCGNIYACEALFNAQIDPHTQAQSLTLDKRKRLFQSIIRVLQMGIDYGGTSVSDYVHSDGQRGTMQDHLSVYKQSECPVCLNHIHTDVIGGRNTHYCPNCQN